MNVFFHLRLYSYFNLYNIIDNFINRLASIYGCPLITPKPSIVPSPPSKNPFTIWDIIFFVLVILIILTGIIGILVGIGLFIRNRLRKVEHV